MTKYYQLVDAACEGRWYLHGLWDGAGIRLDPRRCTDGLPIAESPTWGIPADDGQLVSVREPLMTRVEQEGRPLDWTFDSSDMPVVTEAVAELLRNLAPSCTQFIPVEVESHPGSFYVLNVTKRVDAIDKGRSNLEYWAVGEVAPEKVGKPKIIYGLTIDPHLANEEPLFRVLDWEVALIASQAVRDALERLGCRGVEFLPVLSSGCRV